MQNVSECLYSLYVIGSVFSFFNINIVVSLWQLLRVVADAHFTMRRHASAVYAVVASVCLSQVGILLKLLNVGLRKQCHMIAQDSSFLTPKISAKLKWDHPQRRRQMQAG